MAQFGILFDAQKLGSGFYGYTAFRILFSAVSPRELAGISLFHGEVGDGRTRPYCIALESDNASLLQRVRHSLASSMARGLMPPPQRFMDEMALAEEVLALAARISSQGEIVDCPSRWLQEAWQRAQGQAKLVDPQTAGQPVRSQAEPRTTPQLPEQVPLALRCSVTGRRALAFLVAFSVGGAILPWFGWGMAITITLFAAGIIQGFAIRWRLWAEESLSSGFTLGEARKLLSGRPLTEFAEKMSGPAAQASPLLRRLHAAARARDLASACLLTEKLAQTESTADRADVADIRLHAWITAGTACLSILSMWVFQGNHDTLAEAPRLALTGMGGAILLHAMGSLLGIRGLRLRAHIDLLIASQWLPSLSQTMPLQKGEAPTLEKALHDLTQEFQAMRTVLEHRSDPEFVDTMADLRSSLEELRPVLAGFREPFVLQAVPAKPVVKALSATA